LSEITSLEALMIRSQNCLGQNLWIYLDNIKNNC